MVFGRPLNIRPGLQGEEVFFPQNRRSLFYPASVRDEGKMSQGAVLSRMMLLSSVISGSSAAGTAPSSARTRFPPAVTS